VSSQIRAVTETGDTIFVYDNGTWSFEMEEQAPEASEFDFLDVQLLIDTLDTEQHFPASAKKEVKNARNQFTVKYNGSVWSRIPPATLNEDAEFAFKVKNQEIWSVVISEETPIIVDNLFRIAKKTMEDNTRSSAKILKTEIRKVNGENIFRGVLNANFSGISFIFDTYYFSNDLGSVQFVTWTSETVWNKNQDLIIDMLNGFIVN
jgi:hypothetical protein